MRRGGRPRPGVIEKQQKKFDTWPIAEVRPGKYAVQRRNKRRKIQAFNRYEGIPKVTVVSRATKREYVIPRGPHNEPLHYLEKRIAHRYKGIYVGVTFYHGKKKLKDKAKTLMDYKVPEGDNIQIDIVENGMTRKRVAKKLQDEKNLRLMSQGKLS